MANILLWSKRMCTFLIAVNVIRLESAKILLLPVQQRSHILEVISAVEELPKRGHELHMVISGVTTAPSIVKEVGINIIRYKTKRGVYPYESNEYVQQVIAAAYLKNSTKQYETIANMTRVFLTDCKEMMADRRLVNAVAVTKFDLAVVDAFFLSPCTAILAYHLSIPFVTTGFDFDPTLHAVPALPSFVPSQVLEFSDSMSFAQRLQNTVAAAMMLLCPPFPGQTDTELLSEYGKTSKDKGRQIYTLPRHCELSLINRDLPLSYPAPVMPRTVFVGGLTTKPAKPLSTDFAEIVQNSEHGIVVVTLGSLVTFLPDETINTLAAAFSGMKQTVIWGFGGKMPTKLSANVIVRKWIPQNDLLGSPKTELFVTHSGNNGQFEALYHGVPMVAFAVWGDQHHNAHRIQHLGYGLKISLNEFTTTELLDKMQEVITNEKYKLKIQRASQIYRDKPMNARETAAFWIEHVLKYGSDHLKSAATELPWYSYLMLDVLLFVFVAVMCVIVTFVFCLYFIWKRCKQIRVSPVKKSQ